MTSTPHTDCSHKATSSARAACRKARAALPALTLTPETMDNEGLQVCTACGGNGSADEHGYSYCCTAPTAPRDHTKD